MTSLFINIKIDNREKFDCFKTTLTDIESQFKECHIKIRGKYKKGCVSFAKKLFSNRAKFYQHLQEKNWNAATSVMIEHVKSRSIFFYLEDHRLVVPLKNFSLILKNFDKYQLDYLCYSFFKSSNLGIKNLLPLNPKHNNFFSEFLLNKKNIQILSKISPLYCVSSAAGIYSKYYFKKILSEKNKKVNFYFKKLILIFSIIFPFPKYRLIINYINDLIGFLNFRISINPIDAPHEFEKIITEMTDFYINSYQTNLKFAVLKNELFANLDDDNGAYGESLIKRGLYPFDKKKKLNSEKLYSSSFNIRLSVGEVYDCSYYSHIHRIIKLPYILIKVNSGKLKVKYNGKKIILKKNNYKKFYTNLSPKILCLDDAKVSLKIYDRCFK